MTRILFPVSVAFLAALFTCSSAQKKDLPKELPAKATNAKPIEADKAVPPRVGLKCLLKAYPELLESEDGDSIYWKDGSKMVYDDGKIKTDFETMLNQASLKDQMSICYKRGAEDFKSLPVNDDPGRARHVPFFKKMYGSSEGEVRKHLVAVVWLPKNIRQTLMVTAVNGVDKKIKAISDELDTLPPEYMKYLANPGGTFLWRNIAGTTRLSNHSFGMTIDINVSSSDYWRYDKPDKQGLYIYKNRIPFEIVEVFEKHGFIWGGKWYHYDTMHFEYRPELLVDDCMCRKGSHL